MRFFMPIMAIFFLFFGCSERKSAQGERPLVMASTFAIYDAARHLGKELFDVEMLLPYGVEVHDFEPTPRDMIRLKRSALFFYSGGGLEPWVERLHIENAIDLSLHVKLRSVAEDEHNHTHGATDPHYWLDFENQKRITREIERRFTTLLPQKKERIAQNASAYIAMLERLEDAYDRGLSGCKKSEIVLNHNAYGYLAQRYGFHIEALSALSPDAKSSPKQIEHILKKLKSEGITTVFYEEFENSDVIRSIANDAGVALKRLYPGANISAEDAAKGVDYETLMRRNLRALQEALECDGI